MDTTNYGASAINSSSSHAALLEATLQSLVLLRNEEQTRKTPSFMNIFFFQILFIDLTSDS